MLERRLRSEPRPGVIVPNACRVLRRFGNSTYVG